MIIDQPTMLPGAFAQNGDKNIIPSNNDGLTGLASIEKGFPPITQQPLASGGLPPQRADFNGIFNWLSLFSVFYQNGGVFAYSEDLDYDVSNFVTDGTDLYKCVKENGAGTGNGVQPLSNTTYWDKMLTVGTSANVNYTINDSTVPSDNYGTLISLLSEFANRIKVIGGVNNWYNNPSISLLTLSNLVSNLASGSDVLWSGSKFTNSKLGISGLMAQNGYIQFGPNFGGLIVQWGKINGIPKGSWTAYPIYMSNTYAIVMTDINIANDPLVLSATVGPNNDGFNSFGRRVVDDDGKIYGTWMAIGR